MAVQLADSDEAYVLAICDELLEERGLRQHRFDWLLGDPGKSGRRAKLPVDAYYPRARLVVEYRERQHHEAVPFFDKPGKLTISGVDRGGQRTRYDRIREHAIPLQGLRLVLIHSTDLACRGNGRLRRERDHDRGVIVEIIGSPPDIRPRAG